MARSNSTLRARFPWGIAAVALAYLLYAFIYLIVVPPLEGFDAAAHFNYVNYLREKRQLPLIDSDAAAFSYELPQQPPLYYVLSAIASSGLPYNHNAEYTRMSENPYQQSLSPRWSVTLPDAPNSFRLAVYVARIVSVLGGLLAVVATGLWVRELLPDEPALQMLTASIVAFNPLFVYLSVNITNDAWSVGGATVTMWLLVRAVNAERIAPSRWFVFGCAFGLASLTKYSVMLVCAPALVTIMPLFRRHALSKLVSAGLVALAGALLTSGFWHVRNMLLYGELVPLRQMSVAISSLQRPVPLSLAEVAAQLPSLLPTYWGVFVGATGTTLYYLAMQAYALLGFIGLLVWLLRENTPAKKQQTFILLICWAWVSAVFVGWIVWLCTVQLSGHARLLLIASPAVALLIAFGWQSLLPARARRLGLSLLSVGIALLPLVPLPGLIHDYDIPRSLDEAASISRILRAKYEEGMTIVGADFPQGATITPQTSLPVTIYLKADQVINGNYTLFVHLVDEQNNLLYQFDGVPYEGRHPTRQWLPNQMFADAYQLRLKPEMHIQAPVLAKLIAGFYLYDDPQGRLTARDGNDRAIGDSVVLGQVRVLSKPIQPERRGANAQWVNGLALITSTVRPSSNGVTVEFEWQTSALIPQNYTMFVHLLDANDNLVAQHDQQPLGGQLPTSVWQVGEVVRDQVEVDVPSDRVEAWVRAAVGWYDPNTGQRVKLKLLDGSEDSFVIRK